MSAQPATRYANVGTHLTKRDAADRVTSHATYTEDIRVTGMLYKALVTSPVASEALRGVGIADALQVDGVVRILTANEVTSRCYNNYVKDQPIFARERVRFVGEPIAMVAASSLDAARRAADLVKLDIDETTSIVDIKSSLGSPDYRIHSDDNN